MTQRRIDPAQYVAAADAFNAISLSADRMLADASSRLAQFARMAGDDNGGENFAASYDPMVQQALQNLLAIGQRANGFDRGFMASGSNHAAADAAAGGLPFDAGTYTLRPLKTGGSVSTPASSYGGDPSAEPSGWDVVRDFVGMMWPNADVGKLRQAKGVWDTVSTDVRELATDTRQADDTLNSENSEELPAARAEVNEFATDVSSVSTDLSEIGDLCAEYADSVEEAHNEVIEMLVQLAVEIAAGIAIGAALSAFTFGIGGAAAAGALAARIAMVAGRIAAIFTRLGGTAARIAARLIAIQARVALTANRFVRTSRVVVSVTSGTAASVTAEGIVQGRDANLLAAFGGGLAGGVVTAGIAAPFGRYGERVLVQMLSEGAGGAASGVADGYIRDGQVDIRQVVIQAAGGAALGGLSARSGSRRSASVDAARPESSGTRTTVDGGDGPRVPVGADVTTSSAAAGASGARNDYDGPNVVGSDLSSGGADGGNVRVPDGEAPTAIDIEVTSTGGADAPSIDSPSVDTPSASSVDLGPGSTSTSGSDVPSGSGVDTSTGSGVDTSTGSGVDTSTGSGVDSPAGNGTTSGDGADLPTGTGADAPTGKSDIDSQFDDLQTRTDQAFDDLQTRTDQAFDDLQTKTDQAFDDLQADIDAKFDDIRASLDSDLDVHGAGGADADGPGTHAPAAGAGATAVTGGSIHSSIDGIGDDLAGVDAQVRDLDVDAAADADAAAHTDADGADAPDGDGDALGAESIDAESTAAQSPDGQHPDTTSTEETTPRPTPETPLGTPGDAVHYDAGVRFFGPEQLDYYLGDNATLGRPGDAMFMMPEADATHVHDSLSAAIESGMAPSAMNAWRNGEDVFGALVPVDGLPQRLPTLADAGNWPHFVPGGYTAVNVGGEFFLNPTREFVVDGGIPMPAGTIIFRLLDGGNWEVLAIHG